MTEAKNNVSQPPLMTSIIDNDGRMNRSWSNWFRDLYRRTAYKGGNAIDDLAKAIDDIEFDIEKINNTLIEYGLRITKNEEDIILIREDIVIIHEDINDLQLRVAALEYRFYEIVTTTDSLTTGEFQTIICSNVTPINITLKLDPVVGDEVNIKRRGGTVVVIGIIDGLTNKTINVLNYNMKLVFNGTDWSEI